MEYRIKKETIINAAKLREYQFLEAKKKGEDVTKFDKALAKIVFRHGEREESHIVRLELLAKWAKMGSGEEFEIALWEKDMTIRDGTGVLTLAYIQGAVGERQSYAVPLHAFTRAEQGDGMILEAAGPGQELALTAAVPDATMIKRELAADRRCEVQLNKVCKLVRAARGIKERIKSRATEWREAKAFLAGQTLAEAVEWARIVAFWRRERRKVKRDWQALENAYWIPTDDREGVTAQFEELRVVKLEIEKIDQSKRFSTRKLAKLGERLESLEGSCRYYLDLAFIHHVKAQPLEGLHEAVTDFGCYRLNRYADYRRVLKAWPGKKAELVAEWKTAVEAWRPEKAKLDAMRAALPATEEKPLEVAVEKDIDNQNAAHGSHEETENYGEKEDREPGRGAEGLGTEETGPGAEFSADVAASLEQGGCTGASGGADVGLGTEPECGDRGGGAGGETGGDRPADEADPRGRHAYQLVTVRRMALPFGYNLVWRN